MKTVFLLLMMAGIVLANTDMAPTIGVRPDGVDTSLLQIASIDVETVAGNAYSVGCGFDGTYLWVTNGAGQAGQPTGVFLLFEEDGTYFASYNQNTAPGWGLRDLTCDGTYMYGSVTTAIDYYDIGTHLKVGSFVGPQNPNRALAYDGTYFYTGNFGSEVYRLTWNGVSGSTATSTVWSTAATSVYGAAWDELNNCMWVTSADASGTVAEINASGSLVQNHVLVAGGTYGGACMGTGTTDATSTLWILNQATPDTLLGFEVTPTALTRDTWGAIKAVF
ncbi:MAG: hypothetical protein R6V62_01275 [Candidatus Fermentibacteraceae bacterium]